MRTRNLFLSVACALVVAGAVLAEGRETVVHQASRAFHVSGQRSWHRKSLVWLAERRRTPPRLFEILLETLLTVKNDHVYDERVE